MQELQNQLMIHIRLCVDMTQILDGLQYELNRAKVSSKLYLNKGFHQLELDESSHQLWHFQLMQV